MNCKQSQGRERSTTYRSSGRTRSTRSSRGGIREYVISINRSSDNYSLLLRSIMCSGKTKTTYTRQQRPCVINYRTTLLSNFNTMFRSSRINVSVIYARYRFSSAYFNTASGLRAKGPMTYVSFRDSSVLLRCVRCTFGTSIHPMLIMVVHRDVKRRNEINVGIN